MCPTTVILAAAYAFSQAIEPMISMGTWKVYCEDNNWTIVTRDGSLCSHYEHTVLITDGEPEILSFPGARVAEAIR